MRPDARVWASLAAIPSRAMGLGRVIDSLLPQVNRLHVAFNGDWRSDWLEFWAERVAHRGEGEGRLCIAVNPDGGLGDAEKFAPLWSADPEELPDLHLSCDDDLVYPPRWAEEMAGFVDLFGGRAIISTHGAFMPRSLRPWTSYFGQRRAISCLGDWSDFTQVDFPGTGVMAFDPRRCALKIERGMFEAPNMADMWVGLAAAQAGTPVIVAPHRAGDLGYLEPPIEETIWWEAHRDERLHIGVCNRLPEALAPVEGVAP